MSATVHRGGEQAFEAFAELANLLLRLTVLDPSGGVRLLRDQRNPSWRVMTGWSLNRPLPLRDGNYLRMNVALYLSDDGLMRVKDSDYQYQLDEESEAWIFRYDYFRKAVNPDPPAHLQVRGDLLEGILPESRPLERVHFPTARVSLESVVRLLVDSFDVPCATPREEWSPALALSEELFYEIAHQPTSVGLEAPTYVWREE